MGHEQIRFIIAPTQRTLLPMLKDPFFFPTDLYSPESWQSSARLTVFFLKQRGTDHLFPRGKTPDPFPPLFDFLECVFSSSFGGAVFSTREF